MILIQNQRNLKKEHHLLIMNINKENHLKISTLHVKKLIIRDFQNIQQ